MTDSTEMSVAGDEAAFIANSESPFIPEMITSHCFNNFSQVIFPDIPDFFPPDADININYIVTESIEPTLHDWIGVFRVGWSSPRDYTTYVWAPKPTKTDASGNKPQTVVFKGSQLPGDDTEFYQFCYVTKKGYVRGASTPFQFRLCTENDCLIEVEDETGMIILKTKSDTLQDKLDKVCGEKDELRKSLDELAKAKEILEKELQKTSQELFMVQEKYDNEKQEEKEMLDNVCGERDKLLNAVDNLVNTKVALEEELEKTTAKLLATQEEYSKQANVVKVLDALLKDSQKVAEEREDEVVDIKQQLELATATVNTLTADYEKLQRHTEAVGVKVEEVDVLKEQLGRLEGEVQEKDAEIFTLADELKKLSLVKEEFQKNSDITVAMQEQAAMDSRQKTEEVSINMQRYKDERDLYKEQFAKSEITRRDTLEKLEALQQEHKKIETSYLIEVEQKDITIQDNLKNLDSLDAKYKHETNKLNSLLRDSLEQGKATKTAKELLAKELMEVTEGRDTLMSQINDMKQKKAEILGELNAVTSALQNQQTLVASSEKKLMESHVALARKEIALHQSEAKNEERFEMRQSKADDSSSQTSDEKDLMLENLKKEVRDLKARLTKGADAYKEKYLECRKLEKKVQRLQRGARNVASPVPISPSPSAASAAGVEDEKQRNLSESWGSRFEKFFTVGPDADKVPVVDSRNQQLEATLDLLQQNLDAQKIRAEKYKNLYSEERNKLVSTKKTCKQSASSEKKLKREMLEVKTASQSLREENAMLKTQLQEFVRTSTDSTVINAMTYEADSSTDPGFTVQHGGHQSDGGTDEDGRGFFARDSGTYGYQCPGNSSDQSGTTSDDGDDGEEYPAGGGSGRFTKFNICSESDITMGEADSSRHSRTQSSPITICAEISPPTSRVISRQPIRSPPVISSLINSEGNQSDMPCSSRSSEARQRSGSKKKTLCDVRKL